MTSETPVKLESATPVFVVRDLAKSLAHWRDVLGFAVAFEYGRPTFYAGVMRNGISVHLHAAEKAPRAPGQGCVYLFVDRVDALYEQVVGKGGRVESPPADQAYGLRDFVALDPDGNRIVFASPSKVEAPTTPSDPLAAHIRIETGVPDFETCRSLLESVGWTCNESPTRKSLANTLAGVVAIDTRDGQTIGMVRATGDGKHYMLWDVVVRPSHQGQKIGRTMVERVLDELRARGAPPAAFVGLFTSRPGFYERIGFKTDVGMHRQL